MPDPSGYERGELEKIVADNEEFDSPGDTLFESTSAELSIINKSLTNIGESPIQLKKLTGLKRYPESRGKD